MAEAPPFSSVTIQFAVPGIKPGGVLYGKLFGKPPDFEPYEDFKERKATRGATKIIGRIGNLFGH